MPSELQKDRVRGYMIEAAKKLILADGVDAVSIRKIGGMAGFSYATMYGYFTNRNHLLWHVTMSFIDDIVRALRPLLAKERFSTTEIKQVYRAYVDYFEKNPKVFGLLFFDQIGEAPPEFSGTTAEPALALHLLERRAGSGDRGLDRRTALATVLTSAIHGAILMHLSGKSGETSQELEKKVDSILDYLLDDDMARTRR